MQQNDVPVIKAVHVENTGDTPLRDLRLRISPEPEFADPWEARIAAVAEGSTYNLGAIDLALSPGYLGELTERVRGQLRVEVFQDEERLIERIEAVELLARDEWSGLGSLPEILAAFVMPNHPIVERILRDAADVLGGWTQDYSLSGYQSKDPRRVYTTMGAIYAALQRLELTYINPRASFEAEGQRIRLPDRIVESKMATCLDLGVLAAACLEQAGLHPLIVFVKEHAFVGTWLEDECFGEPAIDDPLRLRKRVDLDEIAVFDPTCVTHRPSPTFDTAVLETRRLLENPNEFLCVVDVQRARKGQIRPIPERVESLGTTTDVTNGEELAGAVVAPDVSSLHVTSGPEAMPEEEASETPATRLDRWRRRLLDLSLRNRLLNFRKTKKTVPLLCSELPDLEDALASGTTFHILPRPRDLAEDEPRDAQIHRRRTGDEPIAELLRAELRSRRVHADLEQDELDRRLLEIYRAARTGMEEGDASALYLAIGFLAWYETSRSEQQRLAPILLVPLELHRQSARARFTLRLGNDEPRLNVTLLELLKEDHGISVRGLDPLPEDESGLDVAMILHTFRETIRDVDRWDILDTAQIGIFSFAKFLMWRDLTDRADDLMKNAVVEHLVNRPDQEFDAGGTFPDADRLDQERSPLQTFCPCPADASQLAAVFATAEGRSFVLEGPPGTGKSQTITNVIAHCLAEAKTVLFVSEKMAALNVVYDRLQKVGLGRYCLELHSNKAHKSGVLSQLESAIAHVESSPPEAWEQQALQLASLRAELNAYVDALHKRRGTGETTFQATSRLIGLHDTTPVALRWPSPDALDANQLAELRDLVERLATAAGALGEIPGHPWEAVRRGEWTPAWEQEVRVAADDLRDSVERFQQLASEFSERVSLGSGGWSLDELDLLDELAGVLLSSPAPPTPILALPDWDEIHSQIGRWIEHGLRRDGLRAEVFERFDAKILALDVDDLRRRLERANASWWPASVARRRRVRKALKSVSTDGKSPPKAVLGATLDKVIELRGEEHALASAGDDARALLGRYWNDGEADWKSLEGVRDWAGRLRSLAARAAGDDFERATELREQWARLATEGRELLQRDGAIGQELVAFRSHYETLRERRIRVDALLELDTALAWGRAEDADALGISRRTLNAWSERAQELNEWCAWRRARSAAVTANLAPLLEAYESGDFLSSDLRRVFERSYYQWWHTAVVSGEPVLAQFFSPEHQRKIDQFREVDEQYMNLTRHLIAARLAEKVPSSSTVDLPNSEVGILKREIGKKRRHIAVRRLFQRIPNLLPRLKPCLLMSPMSVAQYLDADYPLFDLVVFDEASQIPVWDAVGAIARGRQAVIVGDPKQLPPTSFFQRAEQDDEETTDSEVVEDLESILDDCMGARIPLLSLKWHYRSRHESLIAFSNYHYYDNRLLTFASPHREGMGVSWHPILGGVYDRGKSATNRAEADAIVAEVLRRLKDNTLSRWSIGVVTFGQTQQTLIEDLLEQARLDAPEVDAFFSEEAHEPVFVKNLESVQGDERDVILFSICYGPDALGRVSMNFGPMNREGGERRLNVAITRARREVLVFSTLRADQIDLARTRARGVSDLKNFLEYAERGPSAIAEATHYNPDAEFDSPFEKSVYDVLVGRGWEVHQQIGCARYRIDLAVVNPEAPGHYLLGVECDGATYHSAKVARDRDKLREGILNDLGWTLHRIWSTDWFTNPEQEVRKLEAALEDSMRAWCEGGDKPIEPPRPAARTAEPADADPKVLESPTETAGNARLPIYSPYPVDRKLGSQEDFYSSMSGRRIAKLIADVVNREGPISLGLAARRAAAHWHFERIREKVVQRVRGILSLTDVHVESGAGGFFLWPQGVDPETYDIFRVPGTDPDSNREVEDLPIQEASNAARFLLRLHISASEQEIVREASRLFGFRRTGRLVEDRMRLGIERLIERGAVRREGATIILNG